VLNNKAILCLKVDSKLPELNKLTQLFFQSGGDILASDNPEICNISPEQSLLVHQKTNHNHGLFKPFQSTKLTGLNPETLFSMTD